MTSLIVFDDGRARLGQMTDLRCAAEVRTGALTTLERIEIIAGLSCDLLLVPEAIAPVVAERNACAVNGAAPEGPALVVNARCPLAPERIASLDIGTGLVSAETGDLLAAMLDAGAVSAFVRTGKPPEGLEAHREDGAPLLSHPEDVIRHRDASLEFDLRALSSSESDGIPEGVTVLGDHPVFVDHTATVLPTAVLDASSGSVVIGADATVRPGAILAGPCSIGPGSTVLEHAHIKAHTAIGPVCKVGGEIGGTIFQGWANKAHDGHLGDSWVGEWVNFGAGTMNSNLLNTYGTVSMRSAANEPRRRTGLTFLGSIVGDHVKTAIGTRLMTGCVLGTGSMIALTGPAPAFVDRFAWATDSGSQLYRLDKFTDVLRAAMGRRDCEPSAAYLKRIGSLHEEVAKRAMSSH